MTDEDSTVDEVRVESFIYNEDGPGRYCVLVCRAEVPEHSPMRSCGYRGETFTFHVYSGGEWVGSHDVRKFCDKFTGHDDETLKWFLLDVQSGQVSMDRVRELKVFNGESIEDA